MSDFTANNAVFSNNVFTRTTAALWNGLVSLGEASGRANAARRIHEMSNAQLEATGCTREELIRRLYVDRMGL